MSKENPATTAYWINGVDELNESIQRISESNSEGMARNYDASLPYLRPKTNLELLTHYREIEFQMARLVIGWIPTVAEFNLKMDLARQGWVFMEICDVLNHRIKELPGQQKKVGYNAALADLRRHAGRAESPAEFLVGVYRVIQQSLLDRLVEHKEKCDPIADQPTIERIRLIIDLIRQQLVWVQSYLGQADELDQSFDVWSEYISRALTAAGGTFAGTPSEFPAPPRPLESSLDACAEPARLEDGFFVTEEFMFTAERVTAGTLSDILFHNLSELFVPDGLAYMIYDVDGLPYEFYRDFIRQIWDESRHTQMGLRELKRLGIEVSRLPLNTVKRPESYTHTLATIGYTGEGCSFPRKFEAVAGFYQNNHPHAGLITEYDIADEQKHVRQIHHWLPVLHEKEKCPEPLIDVIRKAQFDAVARWEGAERESNSQLNRARQLVGKFGEFCRKVDFEIDFNRVT